MIERPVFFGEASNLLGVVTEPETPLADTPAVLLLNAGLLHRVGPNRLHVDLARRLAAAGFTSLRFDMSGVGDSELPGGGGLLDIERSRQDVVAAIDAVHQGMSFDRFVVMGLCTGAFNAFRAALVDERIVGCALLDGYSYPTLRSNLRHYGARVFQLERWKRYIARRLGTAAPATTGVGGDVIVFENEIVTKDRFERELRLLVARDTKLLLVYTGLGPLSYYYERQILDAFPNVDLLRVATVKFYPRADHTFTLPGHRRLLLDDLVGWTAAEFAAAQPARSMRIEGGTS